MKRNFSHGEEKEPVALIDDIILNINLHVVESGAITMRDLLHWHTINKTLYALWSRRDYFVELLMKAGEKSLQLFEKEKHGYYLENDRRLFLFSQIFPMVDLLHSEIIDHIKIDKLNKTGEYLYKSVRGPDGKFLNIGRLVPAALAGCQSEVLKILSDYMYCKSGWIIETQQIAESLFLQDFMDGTYAEKSPIIYLRPVKKLYTKVTIK